MRIVVPMPPNIGNGSHGHWRTRHREKVAYWETLDMLAMMAERESLRAPFRIPRAPAQPLARATISSTMYLGGPMDDSNAMRRHKWVEDWLVTRGYLADDRKKCLTWTGFPQQVVKRGQDYRIELQLEAA
jgi:hypothetical protein